MLAIVNGRLILPDERVGVIFEPHGDVAEVFITPSLLNDGMPFGQTVGNQIVGMNAGMPILEPDFLHIELLSVAADNLAFQ